MLNEVDESRGFRMFDIHAGRPHAHSLRPEDIRQDSHKKNCHSTRVLYGIIRPFLPKMKISIFLLFEAARYARNLVSFSIGLLQVLRQRIVVSVTQKREMFVRRHDS
jgi:hypothetical protein